MSRFLCDLALLLKMRGARLPLMGIGKRVAASGEAILDRVLCVIGAVLFSQVPEFMQQYLQRLGGHLDEARRMLGQYENIARQAGLSLDAFIARTGSNPDAVVARHAEVMQNTVVRVHDLAAAQASLQDASIFTRPFAFLWHADREIAVNTWAIFKPAVPTTVEGVLYAGAGIAAVLIFYYCCIHYPITRGWRKYQERKAAKLAAAKTENDRQPQTEPPLSEEARANAEWWNGIL